MVNPINSSASAGAALDGVGAVARVRRTEAAASAVTVVTVSAAGARAASQDTAKVATGIVHASADINQDGTVSAQEEQTDGAQAALQRALLEGGPNLDEALQAYQAIAALADVQR